MARLLMFAIVIGGVVLWQSDTAQAGWGRYGGRRGTRAAARPVSPPRTPTTQRDAGRAYDPYGFYSSRDRYSKYYAGFHARYFDEIGVPSGDRGIRGTAW